MTSDSSNKLVFSVKVLSFDFLSAIDIEYDQIDSEDYEYDNENYLRWKLPTIRQNFQKLQKPVFDVGHGSNGEIWIQRARNSQWPLSQLSTLS